MTQEEFDKTGFCGNMWATHKDKKRFMISVNFSERLFGLLDSKPDGDDFDPWEVDWVRCENVDEVEFIKP